MLGQSQHVAFRNHSSPLGPFALPSTLDSAIRNSEIFFVPWRQNADTAGNDRIRILAVTVSDEPWAITPAHPLYDPLERCKLRATLAGCRVTIHEHLDQTISITFGPHLVGRYNAAAGPLEFKPKTVAMVGKSGQKAA